MADQDKTPQNKSVPPKLKIPQMKKPGEGASPLRPSASPASGVKGRIPSLQPGNTPMAPKTVSMPKGTAPMASREESSSQTIHIQLPDLDSASTAPESSKGESILPGAAPKTIQLKAPSNLQVKKFATGIVEAEAKEEGVTVKSIKKGLKGDTSKLPLKETKSMTASIGPKRATGIIAGDEMKSSTGAVGASQTVRISPVAANVTESGAPKPGSSPIPPGHEAPSPAQKKAEKRKTSRISLEAALAGTDAADADATRPKTIRLKRPSEAATIKVRRPVAAKAPVTTPKTAEITPDESIPDAEGVPLTRRKTIRVKRPASPSSIGADARSKDVSDEGPSAVPASVMNQFPGVVSETVNPVFPVFAVASILVAITLIWMFIAQACGPNDSLTELSTCLPSVDVTWLQD